MPTRVRVDAAAIQSMFWPGGEIYGEAAVIANEMQRYVRRLSPHRTGELERSFHVDRVGTNLFKNRATVFSTDPKSIWVQKGTRPTITPTAAPRMILYKQPRSRQAAIAAKGSPKKGNWVKTMGMLVESVSGQQPNNFMERAMKATLRARGYKP